jgi:hypothetical protein
LRLRQEDLPGRGEVTALRRAVEQAHTQLHFQTLDLPAQRRLRQLQGGGRPTEVFVLGEDREVPHQA